MDASLVIFGREPQAWSWSTPMIGTVCDERVPLSQLFGLFAGAPPEAGDLMVVNEDKAINLLRGQRAGVFILSNHTIREQRLVTLNDSWDRAAARIGPFTGVEVIAWNRSNQAKALQSAILEGLGRPAPRHA